MNIKLYIKQLIICIAILLTSCTNSSDKKTENKTNISGNIIIFHAGSLSVPFQKIARAFEQENPGTHVLLEAAGSVDCARKITDLHKPCDLMASSDYKVIKKLLIPKYTSWYLPFAGSEMVIAFNDNSKEAGRITKNNWTDILLEDGVHYGRSDPNADPCGYRALMVMQLAERYYNKPELVEKILEKDNRYIRPKEVDLLALLELHEIDYIFIYRSVAVQHGLKFVTLPDQINLKKTQLDADYSNAVVTIKGATPDSSIEVRGESIVYAITLLNNAPNPIAAKAFLMYLLANDKGMKILEESGNNSLLPYEPVSDNVLPEFLERFTITSRAQESTNDFYDNAETYDLKGATTIQLGGEIGNPGEKDITTLPIRSVIVKEALPGKETNKFIGAYRYDGYALYDILNDIILKKKNEAEFNPITDLLVKVENDRGESVVLSWGELYYPVNRYDIIIATRVARIIPSKTKDLWPLPEDVKLVVAHDLLTERNISNPAKITIFSAPVSYPVNRDLFPLYSPDVKIYQGENQLCMIDSSFEQDEIVKYETIFYGRGRGIHSTTPFTGGLLKDALDPYFTLTSENLKTGYFIIAAVDGYRGAFTFSEVYNRNDQSEILLIKDPDDKDGGVFHLFPSADFFSDRAIKAVSEIRLEH